MSNPYQHRSTGTGSDGTYHDYIPQIRPNLLPIVSGSNPPLANPTIQSNRVSYLLNPATEPSSQLYSTLPSSRSSAPDNERSDYSSSDGAIPTLGSRPPQLPSFSRAFEMFMPRGGADGSWAGGQDNDGFFTPSYLKGSNYIMKLEDAHRAKQTQRETQQSSNAEIRLPGTDSVSFNSGKTPAAHLGLTFDLIERAPTVEHDSAVPPLPTRWNSDDKFGALEVSTNGLEVKCNHALRTTREQDHEISGIRADHPMPSQAGLYYFEVALLSKRREEGSTVCIGFAARGVSLARPPGWETESWGFHGDDGDIYSGGNVGRKFKDPFNSGDIIGCGVNFRTGRAFFTKNGLNLGVAFHDIKGKLYPVVGIKKAGEVIRVNFGQAPFVFKIDQVIQEEQNTIRNAIAGTRLVSPPLSETELIQKLVLQFLQHDGYVETAREFAQEILAEQQALNTDDDSDVPAMGINIKDDDDAHQRQRIRRAILEGDIDKALSLTEKHYPHVLKNNQHVYFKLKCRKFVEMVRKAAECNYGHDKKMNGHDYDDAPNRMDVDENSMSDIMEDDATDSQAGTSALLRETIVYGQALEAEFRRDSRREVGKTLDDIFALLAYPNPLQVKEIAPLLDRKGRVTVAEELNSAILSSLGKSSRSALENLYGQTSVLLDYLREDGGPGSLVSIQSIIDDIPKSQPF